MLETSSILWKKVGKEIEFLRSPMGVYAFVAVCIHC